jgi:hypothetical protein
MSNLIACQPGWVAVFGQIDGDGYMTEPVACWLAVVVNAISEIHPVCALGSDVCDATTADNYLGVVGPGGDPKKLVEAHRASIANTAA